MKQRADAIDARNRDFGLKPGHVPELDHARSTLAKHTESMLDHIDASIEAKDASVRASEVARPLAIIEKHVARHEAKNTLG